MNFKSLSILICLPALSSSAFAANCDVDMNLKSFQTNPKEFMNAAVPKRDSKCGTNTFKYFSTEVAETLDIVAMKDEQRSSLCHTDLMTGQKVCLKDIDPGSDVEAGRAPIGSFDRVENLVTAKSIERNIFKMDKAGLLQGSLLTKPWSDWYWPIYVGQLSYRYADADMKREFDYSDKESEEMWLFMQEWHADEANSTENILMTDVNLLSPAEKYDILMGDDNFTLTKFMLSRPAQYAKEGKVASWMGICHGWAPASYMLPRPVKTVKVTAMDGTPLEFRPSDLKALASQLWASGTKKTKFIGGRCNTKDPETDENGRILEQKCFDNNPGTWHMAVVNQLGIQKKTFVMDATYDAEVWNHPVTSYSYSYFNPQTMEEYDTIEEAVIAMDTFSNDKFPSYRSENAKKVVGVKMEVEYLVETEASTYSFDDPYYDAHNYAYYVYDLELNENDEIIGGEWYTNKHPDFLWTPHENTHATSSYEYLIYGAVDLEKLGEIENLPLITSYASSRGQVIGKVVEALLQKATEVEEVTIEEVETEDAE